MRNAAHAARAVADEALPWVPLGTGKSFKPLRFLSEGRGFVELLRLQPGVEIPWHRHTGEVHAFNLQGSRELHTGETIGPGGYVYEPPGNRDCWKAVGDDPLIVLVIVMAPSSISGRTALSPLAIPPRRSSNCTANIAGKTASSRQISSIEAERSQKEVGSGGRI